MPVLSYENTFALTAYIFHPLGQHPGVLLYTFLNLHDEYKRWREDFFMDFVVSSIGWDYGCYFEVDYGSKEHAAIVYAALDVDKELQPDKVKRVISVSDSKLIVHFKAVEARFLRASFSSLVDLMILATKIIEEFGQNGSHLEQK